MNEAVTEQTNEPMNERTKARTKGHKPKYTLTEQSEWRKLPLISPSSLFFLPSSKGKKKRGGSESRGLSSWPF